MDFEAIEKALQGDKINYDHRLREEIKTWKEKPKILMHSCCAPCSTYSLEFLCQHADVTVYYANSNIYPRSEYERRALVQKQFIEAFNEKTGYQVGFIEEEYKPNEFVEMVYEKQLQNEKEGGKRCLACFDMRLEQVAEKAQELGYDFFASALTISPHKNSQVINTLGYEVQKIYGVKYLPSDFKKKGGFYRSIEMSEEYNLYRQCYCGCVFSAREQGIDLKKVNRQAREYVNKYCGSKN